MAGAEEEEYEETELRLGLPGGGNLKRGFSQTNIDLKLNLNSSISSSSPRDIVNGGQNHHHQEEGKTSNKPPAK